MTKKIDKRVLNNGVDEKHVKQFKVIFDDTIQKLCIEETGLIEHEVCTYDDTGKLCYRYLHSSPYRKITPIEKELNIFVDRENSDTDFLLKLDMNDSVIKYGKYHKTLPTDDVEHIL